MNGEIARPKFSIRVPWSDRSFVLMVYFILKPFYFFDSGLPQICDFFLILSAGYFLTRENLKIRIPKSVASWVYLFMAICAYQFAVDYVWFGVTSDFGMITKAIQYVFNMIAAMVCIYLVQEEGLAAVRRAICNGCFYSIVVTGFSLLLGAGRGFRATGFFNNPNQLGYYAMITLTVVAFFPKELPKWKTAVIVCISVWANILSLSKASVVGIAGLAVCYILFVADMKSVRGLIMKLIAITAVAVVVYVFLYGDSKLLGNNRTLLIMRNRVLNMASENDSSLADGRGYARIFEIGYHVLWGAGEGAYSRFSILPGREVHSTYASMIVCYGLIGFFSYTFLIAAPLISRKRSIKNFACFSGLLLYFITHNGIRNTLLWILIAYLLSYKKKLGAERILL